ncbi:hypothetical protein ACIBJF_36315 [Streptomyces sp. NPDC050743]|uniref:hypothetical protein n=1 Tax=Streptomyces sp. NPDC050743 TaxID=3365634 RepID=UPI003790CD59
MADGVVAAFGAADRKVPFSGQGGQVVVADAAFAGEFGHGAPLFDVLVVEPFAGDVGTWWQSVGLRAQRDFVVDRQCADGVGVAGRQPGDVREFPLLVFVGVAELRSA